MNAPRRSIMGLGPNNCFLSLNQHRPSSTTTPQTKKTSFGLPASSLTSLLRRKSKRIPPWSTLQWRPSKVKWPIISKTRTTKSELMLTKNDRSCTDVDIQPLGSKSCPQPQMLLPGSSPTTSSRNQPRSLPKYRSANRPSSAPYQPVQQSLPPIPSLHNQARRTPQGSVLVQRRKWKH